MARRKVINKDNQLATPVVLDWEDLTPYQQMIVREGRKTGIPVPPTIRTGAEAMAWLRSSQTPKAI